jgi:hypothetical protein
MHRPAPLLMLLALACAGGPAGKTDTADSADPGPGPSPYGLDDTLRLQHVQALGTHNSTHIEPDPVIHPSHAYTHVPLTEQLRDQGVRALELDIHLHVDDGFHVFHLPNVDAETTCLRLADCLGEIRDWSDANPWHLPLMVWMEPKDEDLDVVVPEYDLFGDRHAELEAAILDTLPRDHIFTPDDLRGQHADLPTAIAAEGGWPTLGALRGKVVLSMLDSGDHRTAYLAGNPALEGRLLFVDADSADDPFAATFKINDAQGEAERVSGLVADGFLVTSNLRDGPENDAETGAAHLMDSLAAGAQFLMSDRPAPVDGWSSAIPGGTPARCNAVGAPAECTAGEVEALP